MYSTMPAKMFCRRDKSGNAPTTTSPETDARIKNVSVNTNKIVPCSSVASHEAEIDSLTLLFSSIRYEIVRPSLPAI